MSRVTTLLCMVQIYPLPSPWQHYPFWTKGRGGGRGRGASVSARFVPSGGRTDRKNSFSRFISRCLDQWLYHTTKKIIQLGLNHSFKEISFVCAFVYFFVFLQLGCRVTGCLNGGSCFFDNDKETFVCSCILSWRGERCELGRRAINSFQFSCLSYKNILRAQIR